MQPKSPKKNKYYNPNNVILLRCEEATKAAVHALAKDEQRSVSQMARILIVEALKGRGLLTKPARQAQATGVKA